MSYPTPHIAPADLAAHLYIAACDLTGAEPLALGPGVPVGPARRAALSAGLAWSQLRRLPKVRGVKLYAPDLPAKRISVLLSPSMMDGAGLTGPAALLTDYARHLAGGMEPVAAMRAARAGETTPVLPAPWPSGAEQVAARKRAPAETPKARTPKADGLRLAQAASKPKPSMSDWAGAAPAAARPDPEKEAVDRYLREGGQVTVVGRTEDVSASEGRWRVMAALAAGHVTRGCPIGDIVSRCRMWESAVTAALQGLKGDGLVETTNGTWRLTRKGRRKHDIRAGTAGRKRA